MLFGSLEVVHLQFKPKSDEVTGLLIAMSFVINNIFVIVLHCNAYGSGRFLTSI